MREEWMRLEEYPWSCRERRGEVGLEDRESERSRKLIQLSGTSAARRKVGRRVREVESAEVEWNGRWWWPGAREGKPATSNGMDESLLYVLKKRGLPAG